MNAALLSPPRLPTWEWLVSQEPRLHNLAIAVLWGRPPERMPEFWRYWSREFKMPMTQLVGWDCTHPNPAMHTEEAYNTAFDHLWDLYRDAAEIDSLWPESE